jgi:hypothetical protein
MQIIKNLHSIWPVAMASFAIGSGATTMGSDRANPGAPNPNGPNGGPQAQAIEEKHWPWGPLIGYNVVFWPSEFCKISPQRLGNGISEFRDSRFKHFPDEHALENLCIYGARLMPWNFYYRGAFENFEPGHPDIMLCHWPLDQGVHPLWKKYATLKDAVQSVCKQSLCLHFGIQNIECYSTTIYIFMILWYNKLSRDNNQALQEHKIK